MSSTFDLVCLIDAGERLMSRAFVAAMFAGLAIFWAHQAGLNRRLLGMTVRACIVDHDLFKAAVPCLIIDTANGRKEGYAIIRSPLDKTHFVLTPTEPIIGIEAPQLRGPNAPDYIAAAWRRRRLADPPGQVVPDDDIGLAINSQRGRTQDQLHIHVDCRLPLVKSRLAAAAADLHAGQWRPVELDDTGPYWMTLLPDIETANVVDLAASFLNLSQSEMPQLTLAVFAEKVPFGQSPRFTLVARRDRFKQNAELLLDHDCADFTRRVATLRDATEAPAVPSSHPAAIGAD